MISITRVSAEEYVSLITDRRVFFNEPVFTELNRNKADSVQYLLFKKENSVRFGLILGIKDQIAKCPFSAPYAYPVAAGSSAHMENFDDAAAALDRYCIDNGIREIRFTFPPFIYDEDTLSGWTSAFYRDGYSLASLDINYLLDLKALNNEHYEQMVSAKGRKHLRKAIASGISIVQCGTEEEKKDAYNIILLNHTAKNRPTHMTFEQLYDTFAIVPHGVFMAVLNGIPVASMIYYEVTESIVQCIYSGYLPEYPSSGAMNYLTWYAIQYYGNRGFSYIDRAIATEDSIPNYGLCDFKESVGGKKCLKYSFKKQFTESGKNCDGRTEVISC